MANGGNNLRVPPLSSTVLAHRAADWTEFAAVRAAARALSHKSRLTNALSITVNEVRVSLAAALLSTDRSAAPDTVLSRDDEAARLDTIQRAFRLHAHARAVITYCAAPLAAEWHMSEAQVCKVMDALGSVVGGAGMAPLPAPAPAPTSPPRLLVEGYGQSVHLFLAAVAQGMSLAEALVAFALVGRGQFSHDDKCFFPENAVLGPVADSIGLLHGAERRVVRGCEGEADMTLFLIGGEIAALVSEKRLRFQWLEEAR